MVFRSVTPSACGFALSPAHSRGAGEPARERLLLAGLDLFAEQGYAKTSIRQIAQAAEANVASVSYYFGNKAGLYRTIFWGTPAADASAERPVATLADIFHHILEPLKSGAQARSWIKLHRREMLEPTGLWQEKVDRGMQPMHRALVALLCQRLELEAADDEVEALAMVVIAPAVHLLVNCEVVDVVAPQLLAGAEAVEKWYERLLRGAEALIAAERRRRRNQVAAAARKTPARALRALRPVTPTAARLSRSKA